MMVLMKVRHWTRLENTLTHVVTHFAMQSKGDTVFAVFVIKLQEVSYENSVACLDCCLVL